MDAAVVVGVLGVASTIGSILLTAWLGRRQQAAQTDSITAKAHSAIYSEYGNLLTALRTDSQLAREEARQAKETARNAEQRADAAEEMAYRADDRMRSMERLLLELRPFLEPLPGSEAFVAQIDRLTAAAGR